MKKPIATVAILTFNGEKYIQRIVEAVLEQDGPAFEILVIDSGSTDATLDILRRYKEVRLVQIPNSEFGHGKTRNLAAKLARGKYIAFLTHDAVPTSQYWLKELLQPFELNQSVVAVLGKQVPRYNSMPIIKYDIESVFKHQGPDHGVVLTQGRDYPSKLNLQDSASFYSDVNSASIVEFLRDVLPYRDVLYAEDQMFGRDILNAGYLKAYAPLAAVEHSNDLSLREMGPRTFDEIVGLRRIGTEIKKLNLIEAVTHALAGAIRQTPRILIDTRYSLQRRLYWMAFNPLFHFAKWTAYARASQVDLRDSGKVARGSLEHDRRAAKSD